MNETVRKATWLELFYDLIFVVAIAKTVHTLGHAHSGQIEFDTYFKYVLIMIPLWWAWTGHTLFANRFDTDDALQRVMTLAQMVAAASLSMFIDIDFDPNYHGFLLSYVAIRGLLVLMYGRAAMLADGANKDVARFLGLGFTAGLLISLSSLFFEGSWKYVVLYLGIVVDIMIPLCGRRYLARAPVESHHMPERYALLTIILLGESVANLVAAFESVSVSVQTVVAALAGFTLIAAIWWIYYDNLERRIYGRALGTGQAVIYLHLAIFIGLGGIATMIRFAIEPVLALADYKLLAGLSMAVFLIALQLLLQVYHPKSERGPLLRNAVIAFLLAVAALAIAPTNLTVLLAMTGVFVVHAVTDARRRRVLVTPPDSLADKSPP